VALTLIVSDLLLVGRSASLIVIDAGYHQNTHSEYRMIALGNTLSSRKRPPKCLSGSKTTKNLSKLILNREVNEYEGYREEHN
jgi:hypothetical protein